MITRTLAGLDFEVASPSHYRLKNVSTPCKIDIGYLGGVEDWYLCLETPDGNVKIERHVSRDAAVSMLVQACRNVGLLQ